VADYKSFNDRKLFLEMTGDYVPKSKIGFGDVDEEDHQDLTHKSDAELHKMQGNLLEEKAVRGEEEPDVDGDEADG
jgi:hypothetical protein